VRDVHGNRTTWVAAAKRITIDYQAIFLSSQGHDRSSRYSDYVLFRKKKREYTARGETFSAGSEPAGHGIESLVETAALTRTHPFAFPKSPRLKADHLIIRWDLLFIRRSIVLNLSCVLLIDVYDSNGACWPTRNPGWRGCLNFSRDRMDAERQIRRGFPSAYLVSSDVASLPLRQTDVNHSPCQPNFNDCVACALNGTRKKERSCTTRYGGVNYIIP